MHPNSSSKFLPIRSLSPTSFANFSPPTDYPSSSSGLSSSSASSVATNPNAILLGSSIAAKQKPIHNIQQKSAVTNMVGVHNYLHSRNNEHQHHLHLQPNSNLISTSAETYTMSGLKNNHLTKNMFHNNSKIMTSTGLIDNRMVQSATMGGRNGDFFYQDDIDSIEFCRTDNLILNSDNNSSSNINSKTINFATNSEPGSSFTERRRRSHSRRSNHKLEVEQQVKWTRKNIAATMERFEPTTSKIDYGSTSTTQPLQTSQKSQDHITHEQHNPINHVYSYAYYEPGAAKCHTNIPQKDLNQQLTNSSTSVKQISTTSIASTSSSSSTGIGSGSVGSSTTSPFAVNMGASTSSGIRHAVATLSKSPPRNSIRALLAKSFRSKTLGNKSFDNHHNSHHSQSPVHHSDERHNYTTRYGTTENLYEEVNDQKIRKVLSDNRIVSMNSPTVKEELRRVQHNHFRVLDELNLSLEALIMPPTPPDISPTVEEKVSHASSMENLSSTLNSIELKDHTCINPEFDEGDLDSGFSGSGSSSGASYNESLRYYKTTGNTVMQTTTLPHNVKSCRNSTASGTSTSKSSMNSEDQGIGLTMPNVNNGCPNSTGPNGSSSPFNFVRRCSDSQRSSISMPGTCGNSGIKGKKNFWTIKQ